MNVAVPLGQPPLDFLWFLPTSGDGTYLGSQHLARPATNSYLRELAQAVDRLGYFGVLLPTGPGCEDAWGVATSVVSHTEQLRYLIALRPGAVLPAEAARQAATFDRLSDGRLLLNVVAGGNPTDLAADGIFLGHDERYAHAAEFLTVWRRMMSGETVDFEGRFLRNKGARLFFPPVQSPHPPLWFGGSSDPAMDLAAEQIDTYLTWGEPPTAVGEKVAAMRAKAHARGRTLHYGIRLHFIVRETDDEAWTAARKLISRLSPEVIEAAQGKLRRETDSVGQRRMLELQDRAKQAGGDGLEVSPNLWAGVGLVRGGAGTALVGSPETVAARIAEYRAFGIDAVIGSGYPHLEEAYRVAELLFPLLGMSTTSPDPMLRARRPMFTGGGSTSLAAMTAAELMGGTVKAF